MEQRIRNRKEMFLRRPEYKQKSRMIDTTESLNFQSPGTIEMTGTCHFIAGNTSTGDGYQ